MLLGNTNPVNLRGLKQALFVLHSLEQGKSSQQITNNLDRDAQLVAMWTNFLIHNHWIEKIEDYSGGVRYIATDKGRKWTKRLQIHSLSRLDDV
jgi:hypothetical protein